MKTTKRVLGIVLALAIALTLAVPAAAADTPHPMAPIITQNLSTEGRPLKCGNQRTLAVEAVLPDGAEGQLEYQWYMQFSNIPARDEIVLLEGETGPALTVSLTLDDYKALGADTFLTDRTYWVEITNRYLEDGEEKTAVITSQAQRLPCYLPATDFLQYLFWMIGQLFVPGNSPMYILMLLLPLFSIVFPTTLIVDLIVDYMEWLGGLVGIEF